MLNINSLFKFCGSERAKCLLTLHCFTGCNTVRTFHNVSKKLWTKLFLQIKYQNIFKTFESLPDEIMPKTIEYLAKFVCWGYINRAKHPNLTTLAEVWVHLYKQKNADCEKIPPTMASFYNHILRTFHQLRQWENFGQALIDMWDPLGYKWEENNGDYIPATTANAFTPRFLLELISCNCKKYCKQSFSCHSNWKNCTGMCECGDFCQITGTPLRRKALEEDLQLHEEPC